MAMTMHCDIVSAEEEIFSGRITFLSLVGTLGELGVLPGHAPLLTGIRPGPVRLRLDNGDEQVFFASGGYLEVQPGVVTLLADTAVRAEDIDEAAAAEAQAAARRSIEERTAEVEFSLAAAQLAE
ncbi:MAG: F0F1 ATP synthase subunit epsilon, partial [Gammaproteobacteria bacterium]